jgi:hypothetical protein
MKHVRICAVALVALTVTTPAAAQWSGFGSTAAPASEQTLGETAERKPAGSTAIPEPANIVLFATGVIGLLLGRRGSRSRHDGD